MKAVCAQHGIAYEHSAGCADCLAMERERYVATHDVEAESREQLYGSGAAWADPGSTAEQIFADLEELQRRYQAMRARPCLHDVSPLTQICAKCGLSACIIRFAGLPKSDDADDWSIAPPRRLTV